MILSELTQSTDKEILKVLIKWHDFNTKAIGDLSIPKRYRTIDRGEYLYRGVLLDHEDKEALTKGEAVTLNTKGFSSWSLDEDVATRFADESNGVVIKMPENKLEIWLILDDFLFHSKLKIPNYRDEQEVIVKDSNLTFTKNDIVE